MIRIKRIFRAVLRRLIALRWLRWLFLWHLYKKPIAHSEATISYMKKTGSRDESYWIGKLRFYAHIVDKGLHRGDFTKGHGISAFTCAKDALSHIHTQEGLSDPLVQWAVKRMRLYEEMQSGQSGKISEEYVSTKCSYADLVDVIQTRRSIRRYVEKPVDDETIQRIASVLDWAPTSCHRQPGRIYATNNLERVRQAVMLHTGAACFTDIYTPLFMTFCADSRLYNLPNELAIAHVDVSLGVQNCLLVAHSLGLSLTPLIWSHQGEWQECELRKMFAVPTYFEIIVSVVGGYPAGGTEMPPRKRLELFINN